MNKGISNLSKFFENLRGSILLKSPSVPRDMIDGEPDQDGWISWRPLVSKVGEAEILILEKQLGGLFPVVYQELIKSLHFLNFDFGSIRLYGLPSDDWTKNLLPPDKSTILIKQDNQIFRYLAIASDGNDTGRYFIQMSPLDIGNRIYDSAVYLGENETNQLVNTPAFTSFEAMINYATSGKR